MAFQGHIEGKNIYKAINLQEATEEEEEEKQKHRADGSRYSEAASDNN